MKKYLLFFMVIAALSATSQITVTQADFPSVGILFPRIQDSVTPVLSVGTTGLQNWDFSTMGMDVFDTLSFIDPVTTPWASNFPASNITVDDGSANLVYAIVNANGVYIDGMGGDPFNVGVPMAINIKPNQQQFSLPATNGTSFTDLSGIDTTVEDTFTGLFDSLRIKRTTTIQATVDAWGDVTTPAGTYTTIRQFNNEHDVDSVWGFSLFTGWTFLQLNDSLIYHYYWIASGEDYPVVDATADAPGGNIVSAYYKMGTQVMATIASSNDPVCPGSCDGDATVMAISGISPYTYLWDDPGAQTTAVATGLCAGTYTVTVTDGVSSTATATVTLTDPTPAALGVIMNFTGTSSPTASDGSASANGIGGTPPYSYVWNDPANQTTPTITGLAAGNYTVSVTDNCGQTYVDSTTVVGVDQIIAVGKDIKIYPNPATDYLKLRTEKTIVKSIVVFNVLGEAVSKPTLAPGTETIDISYLPSGMYFIRLDLDGGVVTRRFQKK